MPFSHALHRSRGSFPKLKHLCLIVFQSDGIIQIWIIARTGNGALLYERARRGCFCERLRHASLIAICTATSCSIARALATHFRTSLLWGWSTKKNRAILRRSSGEHASNNSRIPLIVVHFLLFSRLNLHRTRSNDFCRLAHIAHSGYFVIQIWITAKHFSTTKKNDLAYADARSASRKKICKNVLTFLTRKSNIIIDVQKKESSSVRGVSFCASTEEARAAENSG